ncbi:hypothetical protein DT019_35210 [Streptomyces sp. SDr-06]|uniref:hypothetical protein n=1 Tax=Streptomyces sp. SDr-06 TaxID=2267702 RepID=UPI000DEBB93B|nr:hypothetical protein [Streptomyces sp. SDr-06]RCH63969.1 hypothetical protein DT019_35210 [Streptomyces sp. SDr-06]
MIAAPIISLILLGGAIRVIARSARFGIGAAGGILIVVLLCASVALGLGLYSWQRSRRQQVRHANGRLTVIDRRGRSSSVEPTAATAHPVRGSKGESVLLVVSGTAGETPLLLRAEHWDWQYVDKQVFRPAGFTIAVASESESTPRALRTAYPDLRLPFSVARPYLTAALITVGILVLITVVVGLVTLPYLTASTGS